jgi:hypothetical protein
MREEQLMESVPFTLSGVYADLAHVQGVARLDGDDLVLEFRMTDNFVGVFQSALKELRIPLDEIEEVHFRRRFFSGVLTIRARSMRALDAVPGVNDCELGLNCKRRHRNEAQQLATAVTLQLARRLLD